MPFNGSGSFSTKYNWQNDAALGLNISSSRMQGQDEDMAAGLSLCLTKDGQQTPVANIPMGGFRITDLGTPVGDDDATTKNYVDTFLAASSGSSQIGFIQAGTDAILRTAQDKMRDIVSVKDFGAEGDGTTDDSAAIQHADATGKTVFFPDGIYCANNLNMTTGWHMSPGAKIQYNGATEGQVLQCTVDGLVCGDINIDCNALEPFTGFLLTGNHNTFRSINVANAVSTNQTWVVRSIYCTGTYNTVGQTRLKDLVNTGNTNDSSPQGLVLSSPANGNVFPTVIGNNTRSVVVDSSTGQNQIGKIHATQCQDNGFYGVAACSTSVGEIFFDGVGAASSAAGFRHGANASIGQIHVVNTGAFAIFFGDCGDVEIGEVFVRGINQAIIGLNLADTGKIKIGSIKGTVNNTLPFAFQTGNGPVEYLSIDNVDLQVYLDGSFTGSTRSIGRFDAANGVSIGTMKVDVILNGYTPNAPFFIQFNPAMTRPSLVDAVRFGVFESDEITPYTGQSVFVQGLIQANVSLGEGVLSADPFIHAYTWPGYAIGRLVIGSIPTAGTWNKSAVVWAGSPTGTTNGWICTASGTPGTWATL